MIVTAHVDLVYPAVDPASRTTRVRFRLKNDKRIFQPGEYGTVELSTLPHRVLSVPRDAVLDTGESTYVFLVLPEGRFIPRAVVLGQQEGDQIAIQSGLSLGDRVVSGATFLIDAESRLKASVASGRVEVHAQDGGPDGAHLPTQASTPTGCDADFDREKYADKWSECRKCEQVHHGMGSMEADCKRVIPKPWR